MAARPHRSPATLTGALTGAARQAKASDRPKLARDRGLSVGDRKSENMLVVADNRIALDWLVPTHAGMIRAVYIDPPYNTGRRFREYDDNRPTADWEVDMVALLQRCRDLLTADGMLVAQIDDTELSTLIGALDHVFGRAQRIATVTVKRSAATGHKARNLGPVNVSDYLLFYARDRKKVRMNALFVPRAGADPAYTTALENPSAPPAEWTFRPLRAFIALALGHASVADAKRAMGGAAWDTARARFALEHAAHVVRFAEPRFEAVGRDVQRAILQSRKHPSRVLVHARAKHKDIYLRDGQRILFLADKVQKLNGQPTMMEPLTTVWDDVPFQGIAREGGVTFIRNKKPERLLHRILSMISDPGDWVLDPYLGSGTTAAVAHKMGRRWVGVEEGAHALNMAQERLARVVRGQDHTGITMDTGFSGGGGFGVYR